MLQKLRDKTSTWIAPVILGLLTIPFAFFGVEQYMQQSTETWVAKVEAPPTWWAGAPKFLTPLWDKEEISSQDFRERLEQARAEQRQALGDNYDPQAFDSVDNKRAILEELIDQRVMRWLRQGPAASEPVRWRHRLRAAGLEPEAVSQGIGPRWDAIPNTNLQQGAGMPPSPLPLS